MALSGAEAKDRDTEAEKENPEGTQSWDWGESGEDGTLVAGHTGSAPGDKGC